MNHYQRKWFEVYQTYTLTSIEVIYQWERPFLRVIEEIILSDYSTRLWPDTCAHTNLAVYLNKEVITKRKKWKPDCVYFTLWAAEPWVLSLRINSDQIKSTEFNEENGYSIFSEFADELLSTAVKPE